MTVDVAAQARRYHCEQAWTNTCLAACVAMVVARRTGLELAEIPQLAARLCESLGTGRGGALPEVAAVEVDSEVIHADPDAPANLLRLARDLASGDWWLIAMMHPGPLALHHERQRPQPWSRHGVLPQPPAPSHAVVLVHVADDRLLYLDPWFTAQFQPQIMSWADFGAAWTGRYIPVYLQG